MNRPAIVCGALLAAAGVATLAAMLTPPDASSQPVGAATQFERVAFPDAARKAAGRRVLVMEADPGKPRRARILESGRATAGWGLFPATPKGAPSYAATLDALASAAAAAWDRDRGFPEHVERALSLHCVKAVLVDDAGKGAAALSTIALADPVLRLDAGGDGADAVAFATTARTSPSRESEGWTHTDWDDELWGGTVTVRTERPAAFVFPYPFEGAKVRVDGEPATARSAGGLVVLDLPAGTSRVSVTFVEPSARAWAAVAGAAALVAGIVCLFVAIRPSRAELERAARDRADAGGAGAA